MNKKYNVIIPAAGVSSRFKTKDKLFIKLNNELLIKHTIEAFNIDDNCSKIIIPTSNKNFNKLKELFCLYKKVVVIYGDNTRHKSVQKALDYLDKNNQYVLIHDAARPYISNEIIDNVVNILFSDEYDAITTYIDIYDSLIQINNSNGIKYMNRDKFKHIQTPQAFKQSVLLSAFKNCTNSDNYTDEFSLAIESNPNLKTKLVYGSKQNIKITTLDDLSLNDLIENE